MSWNWVEMNWNWIVSKAIELKLNCNWFEIDWDWIKDINSNSEWIKLDLPVTEEF